MDQKDVLDITQLDVPSRLLMGPGPSNAHPRVLQALGMRQVGHLDPKFLSIMNDTQRLLRYVFQTENKMTIPVSGTGSAAMESTFANLIEEGDRVVIFVAGYFGLRMVDMAERYGADIKQVKKPWGEYFTLDEIKAAVTEFKPKIIGLVHADTSTGVLQPMEGISDICKENDCLIILDTVTSLGGVPVYIDKWGIDAAYSGTQKCLSVPPGLSPLTLSERAMKKVLSRKSKVKNWYLDMSIVGKYWGPQRSYHHTAPINMVYAIREGLRLIAEEGLEARWKRHAENSKLLWDSLEKVGLKCLVPKETRLIPLTAVVVPENVNAKEVTKFVLENYNLEIGNGLGELGGKVWRIGLMGYNSRPENVHLCVTALRDALAQQKK